MANEHVPPSGGQAPQAGAQAAPHQPGSPGPEATPAQDAAQQPEDFDGLEGKKPEELTPEELRLMADTMPGEGPGD